MAQDRKRNNGDEYPHERLGITIHLQYKNILFRVKGYVYFSTKVLDGGYYFPG
jgi:hypothetical protein